MLVRVRACGVCGHVNAVHLPAEIDYVTGAILSWGIGTGLHALARIRLKAGETVVVTGAGGGVGIHTVTVARFLGARVIGITSSPEKRQAVHEAGANEVIVAPSGDFTSQVRNLTGGAGVDVVVECVGTPTFESSIRQKLMRCLNAGGFRGGSF